jgi:hypothetical protein
MMAGYKLVQHEEYWEIPLLDKTVCRFRVDSELKLDFLEPQEEETVIIIKGEFQLQIGDTVHIMDAEKPTTLGPVFSLYRKPVKSAMAYHKDGRLELQFWNGDTLRIPPDPHQNFESWEIKGVRGLQVVCMPSGGLAVWSPEESESTFH